MKQKRGLAYNKVLYEELRVGQDRILPTDVTQELKNLPHS